MGGIKDRLQMIARRKLLDCNIEKELADLVEEYGTQKVVTEIIKLGLSSLLMHEMIQP